MAPNPFLRAAVPNAAPNAAVNSVFVSNPFSHHAHTHVSGEVDPGQGRVNIELNRHLIDGEGRHAPSERHERRLTDVVASSIRGQLAFGLPGFSNKPSSKAFPRLCVVIMIIGSRGDIQPFIRVGQVLQEQHHHRVRIATHPTFRQFVLEHGLEFFDIGGDPAELMSFMVKNPGLIPSVETVRAGEIGKRRDSMYRMFKRFWKSCIQGVVDEDRDLPAHDAGPGWEVGGDGKEEGHLRREARRPFIADAIIANPPSMAHVHCAEKLGCPLHLMFTFPYSPTRAFPHPLANIQKTNVDREYANLVSYPVVEMLTWQGLGDLVNRFRIKSLGLEPIASLSAPGLLARLKVPYTYLWPSAFITKPVDWPSHIDLAGFVFLDLAGKYKPEPDLAKFLDAGPPPVYIGFGSIVVDDPEGLTKLLFKAVKLAGVRALISKGWGGLGGSDDDDIKDEELQKPDGVFMLGNVPHDWLFPKVSVVIHHGGAGTTAIGLANGKPTIIVPFFGDQPWWASMVENAGAGFKMKQLKKLTPEMMAEAIKMCLGEDVMGKAIELKEKMRGEDGARNAAMSFGKLLPMRTIRCALIPNELAVWRVRGTQIRLSNKAAATLIDAGRLSWKNLKEFRHKEWSDYDGPIGPLTGGISSLINSTSSFLLGAAEVGTSVWGSIRRYDEFDTAERIKRKHDQVARRLSLAGTVRKNKSTGNLSSHFNYFFGDSDSEDEEEAQEPHMDMSGNVIKPNRRKSSIHPLSDNLLKRTSSKMSITRPLPRRPSLANRRSTFLPNATKSEQKKIRKEARAAYRAHLASTKATAGVPPKKVRSMPVSHAVAHRHSPGTDLIHGTERGFGRAFFTLVKAPMDFWLAVAQGFHNVPRLYGDSVRHPYKIRGFHSGARAAGKELVFGLADGVTGVVRRPIAQAAHARRSGTSVSVGVAKGTGQGLFSLINKSLSSVVSPVPFLLKGVHKELQKDRATTLVLAVRKSQVEFDLQYRTTPEERDQILRDWEMLSAIITEAETETVPQRVLGVMRTDSSDSRRRVHARTLKRLGRPGVGRGKRLEKVDADMAAMEEEYRQATSVVDKSQVVDASRAVQEGGPEVAVGEGLASSAMSPVSPVSPGKDQMVVLGDKVEEGGILEEVGYVVGESKEAVEERKSKDVQEEAEANEKEEAPPDQNGDPKSPAVPPKSPARKAHAAKETLEAFNNSHKALGGDGGSDSGVDMDEASRRQSGAKRNENGEDMKALLERLQG